MFILLFFGFERQWKEEEEGKRKKRKKKKRCVFSIHVCFTPLCRLLLFFLWHLENKQTKTKKNNYEEVFDLGIFFQHPYGVDKNRQVGEQHVGS